MTPTTLIIAGAISSCAAYALSRVVAVASLRSELRGAYRQLDSEMRNRHTLANQLSAAVRSSFERYDPLLDELELACRRAAEFGRTAAHTPGSGPAMERVDLAEGCLTTALSRLTAQGELCCELEVTRLIRELAACEERIAAGRTGYNAAVAEYNGSLAVFPVTLLAGLCGFNEASFLEAGQQGAK